MCTVVDMNSINYGFYNTEGDAISKLLEIQDVFGVDKLFTINRIW